MKKEEALDHTALTFGKYRGQTPEDVSEVDPSYIVWMYDNVKGPKLCSQALYKDAKAELAAVADPDDLEEDQMMGDAVAHSRYSSWGQD